MTLKLHELPADPGKRQKRKRVARGEGSGHGKTAGRGNKGHNSRSGGGKRGPFEGGQVPLVRRIPKFGFNNPFGPVRGEVTLRELNRFEDGTTVDLDTLRKARLATGRMQEVKVIVKGELERKLTVKLHGFSAGARAAIEAKGGSWEIVGK